MTQVTLPSIAYVTTQVSHHYISMWPWVVINRDGGSFCVGFVPCFFQNRYCNRLGEILHLYSWSFWRCRGNWRGKWSSGMVESVRFYANLFPLWPTQAWAYQSNIPQLFVSSTSYLQEQRIGQDQGETSGAESFAKCLNVFSVIYPMKTQLHHYFGMITYHTISWHLWVDICPPQWQPYHVWLLCLADDPNNRRTMQGQLQLILFHLPCTPGPAFAFRQHSTINAISGDVVEWLVYPAVLTSSLSQGQLQAVPCLAAVLDRICQNYQPM